MIQGEVLKLDAYGELARRIGCPRRSVKLAWFSFSTEPPLLHGKIETRLQFEARMQDSADRYHSTEGEQ